MGVQKKEVEATSTLSAEKLCRGFLLDMDTVVPQAIKSVEILEGEGGVGTIKLVTLGEAGQFKTIKQRVDAVDKDALTFSYTAMGGDILLDIIESIDNHFTFVSTDGRCIVKNTSTYNTKGDVVIPEENIKEATEKSAQRFKAVEAYLLAN